MITKSDKYALPRWGNTAKVGGGSVRHIITVHISSQKSQTLCGESSEILSWIHGPPYCMKCLKASARIAVEWEEDYLDYIEEERAAGA